MTFITKRYINLNAGQIHCRTTGKGEALVLLHQTASSSVMYEKLMHELAEDFWLIAPDTMGYGESFDPIEAPTIADYAASLDELVNALGVESAYFFGHHTGAAIAVQLANMYPQKVKKLILSGAPLLSQAQKDKLSAGLIRDAIPVDGSHLLKTWERIKSRSLRQDLALIQREVLLTLRASRYHESYKAVFEMDFAAALKALQCPTLLIYAEHDTLIDSKEAAETLLNTKAVVIPDAGTYLCDEAPEVLAKIIKDFL
jgi:pimeloyl-ACP methyl ester carboxylesterase